MSKSFTIPPDAQARQSMLDDMKAKSEATSQAHDSGDQERAVPESSDAERPSSDQD